MAAIADFVDRFDIWTAEQHRVGAELAQQLRGGDIELVRFAFPDQHGQLRGKTLVASEAASALRSGVNLTTTLLAKDTSHLTVFPVFSRGGGFDFDGMQGGADFTVVADPATFRVLPWARKTGWLLCDPFMADGRASPLGTRQILKRALAGLDQLGFELLTGLEVEFHVFRLVDPRMEPGQSGQPGLPGEPPAVQLLSHGYQYLTEQRYDSVDAVMELLRENLQALGLPLRSLEVEFGPSQFELTFGAAAGLESADAMVLLRSAVKQVCRRHGYHATFMCRPRVPGAMASGWHLHQSLRDKRDGANAFIPADDSRALSDTGTHYLGGLLAHACAATALACPTINGYRRLRPNSLAPDRAIWGRDNRGAMLRVLGGAGQAATRIENRIGEPNANPYLYLASQVFPGLDGLRRQLDPGPSADEPYDTEAELLPRSLAAALDRLRADSWLCEQFGPGFIAYLCHIKRAEIERFEAQVTEWEQREYFDLY